MRYFEPPAGVQKFAFLMNYKLSYLLKTIVNNLGQKQLIRLVGMQELHIRD